MFRHGLSGRWRGAAQKLRRRLSGGEPENSAAVTKPDTKREPSLLALLEDDIRQCLGALSAELNCLRGTRSGRHLSATRKKKLQRVNLLSWSRVRIASYDAAFERATQGWDWVASASRHVWR